MTQLKTSPFYVSPKPVLLAEHSRTAVTPGVCALGCGWPVAPGQRVAIVPGRGWAHLPCIATLPAGEPR